MIHGFVVIDKPAGITSHDVVSRVRRILGTRKVGHTGTLDPFATGVLPVAVNDGTKVIPFLDEGTKCYKALLRLGVATDTLDMTGRVLTKRDFRHVDRKALDKVLSSFNGIISQLPPMYSAIKQNGQPLYKLARQGQEVERKPRQVEISEIEVLDFAPPLVSLRVSCSRGTYVRSLADDIGQDLGCGAALQELRRTCSGPFAIEGSCTLDTLDGLVRGGGVESVMTKPVDVLSHLPIFELDEANRVAVRHGRAPLWQQNWPEVMPVGNVSQLVRLTSLGDLVAVAGLGQAEAGEAHLLLRRVFV